MGDSFGPRRLMKKYGYDQNGFSTRRLMKRQFDDVHSFDPRTLMKKDSNGFDVQRLMKKELWSTRLIREEEERARPIRWTVLELPTDSQVWEPIAEVHEPPQGHWR